MEAIRENWLAKKILNSRFSGDDSKKLECFAAPLSQAAKAADVAHAYMTTGAAAEIKERIDGLTRNVGKERERLQHVATKFGEVMTQMKIRRRRE